jgi:hypothetical protein
LEFCWATWEPNSRWERTLVVHPGVVIEAAGLVRLVWLAPYNCYLRPSAAASLARMVPG